jgi:hypothetical protein
LRISAAETIAVAITCWLAFVVLFGYAFDAVGLGVQPAIILVASIGGVVALLAALRTAMRLEAADLAAWTGVVAFVLLAVLRVSWPSLVPPGRGPDLTHHLLLVDYIEQQQHLVHDRSLDGVMGEMAHYTPGAHLLAVVVGAWAGVDGTRAFFPLLAVCAALSAGFVFLIARRLQLPLPYAIAAVVLLFLPAQYFSGAFTHDSFLAQTVATFFAVAVWWALVAGDEERSTIGAAIIGLLFAAVFLTWPIWLGPLLLVFVPLTFTANDLPTPDDLSAVVVTKAEAVEKSGRRRAAALRHLAIGILPLLVVASIHLGGRWGWLGIVRTSGAVLEPSVASLGWALPLLAIAGAAMGLRDRGTRVTIVLLLLIGLQAITLWVIATSQGADTPYMAYKMMYLAIYPAAALAACALARLGHANGTLGWIIATILVILVARPVLTATRVIPVIDLDLYEAGKWTRAHVGQTCVDYLVRDAETAYWLHLAVLGNPRVSDRMIEIDRYDPNAAMAPWITAAGRSYAIADLRLLPDEVRSRVAVVAQYGSVAVIRRQDATMKGCD